MKLFKGCFWLNLRVSRELGPCKLVSGELGLTLKCWELMGREEFVQGLRPKGMGRITYWWERERDICLFVRSWVGGNGYGSILLIYNVVSGLGVPCTLLMVHLSQLNSVGSKLVWVEEKRLWCFPLYYICGLQLKATYKINKISPNIQW